MTKRLYHDYLPLNANIVIDYNAQERVKFSYPKEYSYWRAVWKFGRWTVTGFWWAINIKIAYYLILIVCFFLIIYYLWTVPVIDLFGSSKNLAFQTWKPMLKVLIFMFYLLGVPTIYTFIIALNKEWFSKLMPNFGYLQAKIFRGIHRKIFIIEDIIDNKLIIPSFNNVYLKYKCHGDFGEKLEKIEVMALPFKYSSGTKKYKEKEEEFNFSAVFYFSSKPKRGFMDVQFSN